MEALGHIDYQLGAPIEPLGRQARLNDSMEKVDFLAKSVENVYFPIELKIKPASGSDFTQVQSYRQDLINRGVQSVIGVHVAPGFSTKVINVARGQTDILLRTIDMPVRRGS